MPANHDVLLVFVKAPRSGTVKTRLAAAIGDEAAAALYRTLAEHVVRATEPAAAYERVFFFDPPDAGPELQAWLRTGEPLRPQAEGDLGTRMAAAFAEAFGRGARRVAVIGTDTPAVSRGIVSEALDGLLDHDVVLGPARDGGYYLLALDRPRPELFRDVPWSTPAVWPTTLERAAGLGLRVRQLETLGDVDTLDDVRREWERLRPILEGAGLLAGLCQVMGMG